MFGHDSQAANRLLARMGRSEAELLALSPEQRLAEWTEVHWIASVVTSVTSHFLSPSLNGAFYGATAEERSKFGKYAASFVEEVLQDPFVVYQAALGVFSFGLLKILAFRVDEAQRRVKHAEHNLKMLEMEAYKPVVPAKA
ncbi:hypothetical protein JCM11251_001100 [Rhodosporidiobolus azoricus]